MGGGGGGICGGYGGIMGDYGGDYGGIMGEGLWGVMGGGNMGGAMATSFPNDT